MKRKLLLSLLGILAGLPILARDFEYTYEGQTVVYTVLDEEAKTCATRIGSWNRPGNDISGKLVLPSNPCFENEEYTLTSIGDDAFQGCSGLTEVTIPNSVTSIGVSAFEGCSGLTEVTIPNSVTSIGAYAFDVCSGLTEVTIPNSVTSIGNYAFYKCSGLTEVRIGNSVTSIGNDAFEDCSGLTEVTIPNSVTSIGDYAFERCGGLASLIISDGDTEMSIGKDAFKETKVQTLYVGRDWTGALPNSGYLTSLTIGDSVTSIGDSAFSRCSGLTEVMIGNSVTSIGVYAFLSCSGLTEVTIPNSVTSIGYAAFEYCGDLTSFTLSDGDADISIGDKSFSETRVQNLYVGRNWTGDLPKSWYLTSLTIGDSVTSIGSNAFEDCSGLKELTIPNSVTSIGGSAFQGCSGLTSVTLSDGDTDISIGDKSFFNTRVQNLYVGRNWTGNLSKSKSLTSLTIGDSVTSIYESAFEGCSGLTEVTIPNSVTSIGGSAFRGCSGLTEVTIPNSVTSIGDQVFSECNGLTSFTLSDGDTEISIGANSFNNTQVQTLYVGRDWTGDLPKSKSLTAVTIGNSVTSIYESAFEGCSGLTEVTIPNSVTSIGGSAFQGCSGLTEVTIPNSVTGIGGSAFQGCSGLTEVSIPNSVTSLGESSFSGCSGLTEITIPNTVTAIGSYAFNDCGGLKKVYYSSLEHLCSIDFGTLSSNPLWCAHNLYIGENKIEELVVPTSVKDIKARAFAGGNFTTVNIPNSVMTIGKDAFADCTEITTVRFEDSESPLNLFTDAFQYYKDNNTYYQVINDLYLGRNIANRTALWPKNLVIGNLVTEFYNFKGNKNLVSLTLGSGLTAIPADAFNGCSSLTEVTIPNSITSIGDNAFSGIELKTLTLETTEVPEFSNLFSDSFNSATLNVPEEAFVDYLLSSWNMFRNISDGKQVSTVATDNSLDYHIFKSTASGEVKNEAILIPGNYGSLSSVDILDRITVEGERYYVTGIGYGAFADCKNLKSVNFNARADIHTIGISAFENCSGLTEFSIPNTVTSIGTEAFCGCVHLMEVTIGNSVKNIGSDAFKFMGGLLTGGAIVGMKAYYSSLEHLCSIDFGTHSSNPLWFAHKLYIGENKIEKLVVPSTVKDIKAYAFAGGNFTSVTIPSSVTTIGKDAFADCKEITTVRFEDGVSPLDLVADAFHCYKDNETTYYKDIYSLYLGRNIANRTSLRPKNLVIGNLVTEFCDFKDNNDLVSLTLGSGLTAIPAEAFNGCSLSEVAVPVNVTEIGENAFANNNGNLTKVSMGYKLANIGEKAFDGNTIETVNVAAMTPPEAPDNVFSAYSGKLYVPAEKVDDYYDSWSCWSRFAGYPLVDLEKIEGSADKVSGQIGETVQLSVTLTPENLSLPYVFWRSTNPELAIVNNNGRVTIVGGYELGECKIIAETLYDTDKVATFDVKSLSTGIFEIVAEEGFEEFGGSDVERANDIFTLEGVCLKRNATKEDIDALAPGIYIVAGKKMVVK